ncbi:MAG: ATP phosphoribosyltransferase regulatory subunit [Pseudomonas oryzihabitans]
MATVDRWLLPDGIEEILPPDAARIEGARRRVLELFHCWGYEFVITPHLEFLESLLTGAAQELELRTFKVTDPNSGRLMGFRSDITPQVARMDAHSLKHEGASRLCYAGSVLHTRPRALSTSRSPIQVGAELYGVPGSEGDLEVISLMLDVLEQAQVPDVHMDLGHVGIYRGLCQVADVSGAREQALFDALQRKAVDEIDQLTAELPAAPRGWLRALVELSGDAAVLGQARQRLAGAPAGVLEALDELVALAESLQGRFPNVPLYFDLGELRGYHYHTGVVFAAFVPGTGQSIAQGGRYDNIGADFGRSRPATGFSTDLKTLVELGNAVLEEPRRGIWAPAGHGAPLWQAVCALRAAGERIIQATSLEDEAQLRAAGCDRRLVERQGAWVVEPLNS